MPNNPERVEQIIRKYFFEKNREKVLLKALLSDIEVRMDSNLKFKIEDLSGLASLTIIKY